MELRFDRAEIRAQRSDSGYITDTPILTRTGVFLYKDAKGNERREYRPPEVVFAADSLALYRTLPITDGHPGKVTAQNVKMHLCGTVISAGRQDGENLLADIVIHDPLPVAQGKKELSVGYEVEFDETPGIAPNGERYDAKQIAIRPNHLALVFRGRAGTARLNLDAADAVDPQEEVTNMQKVKLASGLSYDAAPEVAQEVDTLRAQITTLQAAADTATARADSVASELTALQGSVEKIKQDAADDALAFVSLQNKAKELGVTFAQDAKPRAIKEAVIKAVRGATFNMDGKSDAYVDAAFDMAASEKSERTTVQAQNRQMMTPPAAPMNQDGTPAAAPVEMSASSARARYLASLRK